MVWLPCRAPADACLSKQPSTCHSLRQQGSSCVDKAGCRLRVELEERLVGEEVERRITQLVRA